MKKSFLASTLILSLLASTFVPTLAPAYAEETTTVSEDEEGTTAEETTVAETTVAEETSNAEESSEDNESSDEDSDDTDDNETNNEETPGNNEETPADDDAADWEAFQAKLQEILEAEKVDVLYKNLKPINLTEDVEGIDIIINGYYYYEISNFDVDWEYVFGDQTEKGGVIVYDITLKNTGDQDLYPVSTFNTTVTGNEDYITHNNSLVKESQSLNWLFHTDNEGVLEAGKEIRGFYPLAITPNTMEKIEAEGIGLMETPTVYTSEDFETETLLARGTNIRIPFTTKGEEIAAAAADFYPDVYTLENWGNKTLVDEVELSETIESQGLSITIDSYQLTELEPNEDYKDRFADFEDGAYLLTVAVTYDNQTKKDLQLDMVSGTLALADMIRYFSEGLLEPRLENRELPAGETASRYHTFLIDGKTYEKFAEDEWVLELKPQDTDFDRLGEKDAFFFELK
uniref:DUF5068 domain-containing protein n=1 Tax=Globicatella sulfidifaciens TaxID=136093 RepID=UPI0023F232CC|nr:DUF5068 domain-containing protein [Globicatella sulfidifaciens]